MDPIDGGLKPAPHLHLAILFSLSVSASERQAARCLDLRPISILEANNLGIVLAYGDPESRDLAFSLALETIAHVEGIGP